jgi:hypothetical protein
MLPAVGGAIYRSNEYTPPTCLVIRSRGAALVATRSGDCQLPRGIYTPHDLRTMYEGI